MSDKLPVEIPRYLLDSGVANLYDAKGLAQRAFVSAGYDLTPDDAIAAGVERGLIVLIDDAKGKVDA